MARDLASTPLKLYSPNAAATTQRNPEENNIVCQIIVDPTLDEFVAAVGAGELDVVKAEHERSCAAADGARTHELVENAARDAT